MKKSFFALLANFVVFFDMAYMVPLLSTHWYEIGFSAESLGFVFTFVAIAFAL